MRGGSVPVRLRAGWNRKLPAQTGLSRAAQRVALDAGRPIVEQQIAVVVEAGAHRVRSAALQVPRQRYASRPYSRSLALNTLNPTCSASAAFARLPPASLSACSILS